MHQRFLRAVEKLPAVLRETFEESNTRLSLAQLGVDVGQHSSDFGSSLNDAKVHNSTSTTTRPRSASISIVAGAAMTESELNQGQGARLATKLRVGDHSISTRAVVLPKSTLTSKSSSAEQLIAAIFDGDIQGIRTIIRSRGDDLRSEFWKKEAKTIMPLHRAIAGLHFHGSEKTLLATLETLLHLQANIFATDNHGNTILHKAILICTSKNVYSVVKLLLNKGADFRARNKIGDMPIHLECKRFCRIFIVLSSLLLYLFSLSYLSSASEQRLWMSSGSSSELAATQTRPLYPLYLTPEISSCRACHQSISPLLAIWIALVVMLPIMIVWANPEPARNTPRYLLFS